MKIVCISAFGLLLAACATMEPQVVPLPSADMASVSGVSLERLERGRHIYETDCTRCHEAKIPAEISEGDWHVVVPGMAWNSGISSADEDAVLDYILAAKQMP